MSLPETTAEDLHRMGITPQAIRDKLKRSGHNVDGDIVGYFLPGDGWEGHSNIRRARTNLKYGWRAVKTNPPEIVKVEEYSQSFGNFEGDAPTKFTFNHTVAVTTAEDYTQTERFEVGVNANIPLGDGGALAGFNATMSSDEVQNHSKAVTETREIHFPLTIPRGERQTVNETTTVKSITTLYESAVRAEGSVGIEVDPGSSKPNVYLWYYNIENIFPDAVATSRISRSSTNTDIDTSVFKVPKETDAMVGDIVEYHFFNSDNTAVHLEAHGIALSSTEKDRLPDTPPLLTMTLKIQFAGVHPEVPLALRQQDVSTLRNDIVMNVHPIGIPSVITYASGFASGKFSIPYNSQLITHAQLGMDVINQANSFAWGGKYVIYFS